MNVVTMSDLRELVSIEDGRCVSMYMPTHPSGRDGQQDEVRVRNLVTRAEQQLVDRGMRGAEARELLTPVIKVPQSTEWRERKQGLAVLRSQKTLSIYWLDTPLEEALVVGRRFYVKPLLPATIVRPEFLVLAISRNQVRLLKATPEACERLQPQGLPTSMERALNLQGADRGEQVHSGMHGDVGKEGAVFHGQGGHRDTVKDELIDYFQLINQSLKPVLRQTTWPLILAGVDYEVALFRESCDYPQISDEALHGAFDHMNDGQLYEHALPIARRLYGLKRQHALTKYRTIVDRKLASDDMEEILPAAHEGKIDSLFVDCDTRVFGRYDSGTRSVEIIDGCDPAFDIVELAIEQTILHRGAVYQVTHDELPSRAPMCAIFRY